MKVSTFFSILFLATGFLLSAQTNIKVTNSLADSVLFGNYNPENYAASQVIHNPHTIAQSILNEVSADSLKSYIIRLSEFGTRHTSSDTVSNERGIGAARRWVHEKFESFSDRNENRLLPGYLQFNYPMCGVSQHRNIMAVLPGRSVADHGIVIIEGHIDSRCEGNCDVNCEAQGVEDNASGTALVMELARVMSRYTFNQTLVFLVTIGEEQGLYGARAFANYCFNNDLPVKAVFNNDVIGGIACGKTSSPPSCPGENHIDSTQVRLFSSGGFNSPHKQLARFAKLEYKEEILPLTNVPILLTIMSAEDRTGRGGDHIPFRQRSFPAMRFTSANEHGDAGVGSGYTDRQHTTRDILGIDTDGDSVVDSFFVNFNYLARNTVINGNAATMAAIGPKTPGFEAVKSGGDVRVEIFDPLDYDKYRVCVRTTTNDFDTVYTLTNSRELRFPFEPDVEYIISVASVDGFNIESLFSEEVIPLPVGVRISPDLPEKERYRLLQNRPNPFDESTIISFVVNEQVAYKNAYILIQDLQGREVQRIKVEPKPGMNEVLYEHGYGAVGTFNYSLVVDGEIKASRQMIFAN